MNSQFTDVASSVENEIFKVVFFPDRIYHAAYLNATASQRYHYNVTEVRNKHDITFIKAKVFQDGQFLANVFRIEYHGTRLTEVTREKGRVLHESVLADIDVIMPDNSKISATVTLTYCPWIRAFQCEIWDTLEPVSGASHHFKVLSQMGNTGTITHIPAMDAALKVSKDIKEVNVNFREALSDEPLGYNINDVQTDNNYLRSYQVPNTQNLSDPANTVNCDNYMLNFQRGWFLDAEKVPPVRYRNAMMESHNPAYRNDDSNVVEMRWILQREMGGNLVYFHQVNVTPNSFEGVHQHIGSEELYYIVSGNGIAYMGADDDPTFEGKYPVVKQEIYCVGEKPVREIPVNPGKVIYTKSGGIHGIRNTSATEPLIFVAFGYHCS